MMMTDAELAEIEARAKEQPNLEAGKEWPVRCDGFLVRLKHKRTYLLRERLDILRQLGVEDGIIKLSDSKAAVEFLAAAKSTILRLLAELRRLRGDPERFHREMECLAESCGGDAEDFHHQADKLLCEYLRRLGYEKGVEIFQNQEKWYA